MKKSLNSTLLLGLALLGLFGWYFLYEQRYRPDQTQAEEKSKRLVNLESSDVKELDLKRMVGAQPNPAIAPAQKTPPKFETLKFKKLGTDWVIVSPLDAPADTAAVSSMVSVLTSTGQERIVDEKPADLETYGLKTPLLEISVRQGSSAASQTVLIGNDTPVGSSLYVKTSGADTVYRASKTLRSSFDKDLKTLRNKGLVKFAKFEINEVEIQPKGAPAFMLSKTPNKEQWTLAKQDFPADMTEWNKTLTAVADLKATDFPDEKPASLAKYGLETPAFKINVGSVKGSEKVSIWLGEVKGKYYAKLADKPPVYEVSNDLYEKAKRPLTEYRDKHIAIFDRFATHRVKLERGKDVLELLKEGPNWTFPTEPGVKVDGPKVDTLLSKLQDTQATTFLDAKNGEIKSPSVVIRLFQKVGGKESESLVLTLDKPTGKVVKGERKGLSSPFLFAVDAFKHFDLKRADFLPKAEAPKKDLEKKS